MTIAARAAAVATALSVVAGSACSPVDPGADGRPLQRSAENRTSSPAVLVVATGQTTTLDPMRIRTSSDALVARQLYESLTRWDPVEQKVVPAAAESWEVAEGGRTFTFRLRPGMTFHDGSPVTADDFVYAFDRIAQKASASELAYVLEPVLGFPQVNEDGASEHLAGLSALNDLTLVVQLAQPYHDLPAVMSHPALVPLPRRALTRYDRFLALPVGNGPFRMAQEWAPGAEVVLEAFGGFLRTPALDGLRMVPYPDAAASWLSFLDGQIDVAQVPGGQVAEAREKFGDRGFSPVIGGYYFGFNIDAPQLDERRLRRAVNLAIDRDDIAHSIYNDSMTAPRGVVPAGMPGFLENVCADVCEHDPEAAVRLVARLRPGQRRVAVQFTRGEPHAELARRVGADLKAAGLRVTLKGYRFARFVRMLNRDEQTMYRLGWIAEYPVADAFLSPLFHSDSPDNHTGFASAKVDALLARARAEPSDGRRTQLYIAAEKEILRSAPIAPVGSFVTHWAAQPWVTGIEVDVMGGFDAVGIAIDETGTGDGGND